MAGCAGPSPKMDAMWRKINRRPLRLSARSGGARGIPRLDAMLDTVLWCLVWAASAASALVLLFALHMVQWPSYRTYRLVNKIHGPKGWPLFGFSIQLARYKNHELIGALKHFTEMYPRLAKFWIFGLPQIIIQEPEDLEVLMGSVQHITKGNEYFALLPWLKEGLLTSTGDKWHQRRKMLTNAFHFRILEDSLPTFNKNSVLLANKLLATGHQPTDVESFVKRCTLDIICESANGVSLGAQNDQGKEYVSAIKQVCEIIVKREISFWMYKDWMFYLTPIGMKFSKLLKILQDFTYKVISERRSTYFSSSRVPEKSPKRRMAFLDTLLEVEMNKPGTLSQDDIRQEVDTFTFEGHDTTSASLVFTLFLLGSHPEIQDKVAEELYSIFGDSQRSVEMKDLQQMVYLEKVIKESLRLYPSVPYISRALIHDLNLPGDVLIPKGANVIILPYILHRNKRFYPDPEVFDPERFNEDQCLNRHPFAYIPFSAGPRNCIGQKFAMMALKIILSTIIRKAKIESITTKEELRLLPFLILRPSEPIMIKVKPRQVRAESTV